MAFLLRLPMHPLCMSMFTRVCLGVCCHFVRTMNFAQPYKLARCHGYLCGNVNYTFAVHTNLMIAFGGITINRLIGYRQKCGQTLATSCIVLDVNHPVASNKIYMYVYITTSLISKAILFIFQSF